MQTKTVTATVVDPVILAQSSFTNQDDKINVTSTIDTARVFTSEVSDTPSTGDATAVSIVDGVAPIVAIKNVHNISAGSGKDQISGKI